jgi:hypothetical protein
VLSFVAKLQRARVLTTKKGQPVDVYYGGGAE